MKSLYTFLFSLMFIGLATAQLTITEISYNPPESNADSLEYIEVLNTSGTQLDLTGYTFTKGVEYTFDQTLGVDQYLLVAVNADAMQSVLGVTAAEFNGALSNGGEEIEISDASGVVVDAVDYSSGGLWPSSANGTAGAGSSIELCDVTSDNNEASSWRAATEDTGATADGKAYLGTPGAANTVVCMEVTYPDVTIEEATELDANGVAVMNTMTVSLTGIVHGVNLNPAGLQFFIINSNNEGIGLYSGSETFGYTVMEGDNVTVEGGIEQYNGLTQISPVSLTVNGSDTPVESRIVASLDESTESSLVTFNDMLAVDISQWTPGAGQGFNVEFQGVDGTIIAVRIDNDTDLFSSPADFLTGEAYDITGIGGQYDDEGPELLSGYQLLPRYLSDIAIVVSNTSDIQPSLNEKLVVYPNPTSDILNWNLEADAQILNVSVLNQMGQTLSITTGNQSSLQVGGLTSGYYMLKVQTENQNYFQTFVRK